MSRNDPKEFLGVMPFEEMVKQYPVPDREANTIDWSKVDEDSRWWIAGQFDGDGSIGVYPGYGLKACIGKAENGWSVLIIIQEMLGGNICDLAAETDKNQASRIWYINNRTALEFCRVMRDYCFLKRPQIIKAFEYPADKMRLKNMQPVVALDIITKKPVQNFVSMLFAAKTLKTQTGHIAEVIRGKKPTCAKFKWAYLENPVKRDQVDKHFKSLTKELKKMKHIAHEELLEEMPLAYAAGFVDADGSIAFIGPEMTRNKISVGQKYRAICDAFRKQFGGSIWHNPEKPSFSWTAHGDNAQKAIVALTPYLKEKNNVIRLISQLKSDPEMKNNIMDAIKGKKGKGKLQIALRLLQNDK